MTDVQAYFEKKAEAAASARKAEEFCDLWRQIADFYSRRLWHQVTTRLEVLVTRPEMSHTDLQDLYQTAISDFESKLKPVSLVQIAQTIAESIQDMAESKKFIENIGEKVKKDTEAFAFTRTVCAKIMLERKKDMEEIKAILEEASELLDTIDSVGKVHRMYYGVASLYHCNQGNHAEFYQMKLRYLGCSSDPSKEKYEASEAAMLSLAALLGAGIFNFGELLAHPILQLLKGTADEWLMQLLDAFNRGDVKNFQKLKPQWSKCTDLAANEEILYEKICLLALMNMTFERTSMDRQISFSEVSEKTGLPEDKVELLVMKAQSGGLIKAQIDQVIKSIHVSWVQPRVLDKEQLKVLMGKVDDWSKSIKLMEDLIHNNAREILTA